MSESVLGRAIAWHNDQYSADTSALYSAVHAPRRRAPKPPRKTHEAFRTAPCRDVVAGMVASYRNAAGPPALEHSEACYSEHTCEGAKAGALLPAPIGHSSAILKGTPPHILLIFHLPSSLWPWGPRKTIRHWPRLRRGAKDARKSNAIARRQNVAYHSGICAVPIAHKKGKEDDETEREPRERERQG